MDAKYRVQILHEGLQTRYVIRSGNVDIDRLPKSSMVIDSDTTVLMNDTDSACDRSYFTVTWYDMLYDQGRSGNKNITLYLTTSEISGKLFNILSCYQTQQLKSRC